MTATTEAAPTGAMGDAPRRGFPVLRGEGAKIDYQLVADHAEQARANHYQSVDRLAERGGLSWCELYAVLHNRRWEKMDINEAMIACRALESRYLDALTRASDRAAMQAAADALEQIIAKLDMTTDGMAKEANAVARAALATLKGVKP